MSIFKALINSILPPTPIEVAPQIVTALLNLHTDTSVFTKFSELKKCREIYPNAVKEAYGVPDTCSFQRFEEVIRAAILSFLWWEFGEYQSHKILSIARMGIPIAADWKSHCNGEYIQRDWGQTNKLFNECKSFIESEIYHIPKNDEPYMRYFWQEIKAKPDVIDRYFSCSLNWAAQRLFIDTVTGFRGLDNKIPFYHAIREYLYECSMYCERRIEREIELAHF